jgi:hypothetical protein
MNADDVLAVVLIAPLEGKEQRVPWIDFNPRKFAHHIDE